MVSALIAWASAAALQGQVRRLPFGDPHAAVGVGVDAQIVFQRAPFGVGDRASAEYRADIGLVFLGGRSMTSQPLVAEQHRLGMIPFAGPGSDQQPVAPAVFMPQQQLREGPGGALCGYGTGFEAEKGLQERLHGPDHRVGIQSAREQQRLAHALLPRRAKRGAAAQHGAPAGLLLGVNAHALIFHLLPGQILLLTEKALRPLPAQRFEDRPFGDLLFIYTVFQPQPEELIELRDAAVMGIALEKSADLLHVQPFFRKADHHVEIVVRRSVGKKSHKRRLEIIPSGGVPYDVSGPPRAGGKLFLDHAPKTTSRVRSDGSRAAITSRIRERS